MQRRNPIQICANAKKIGPGRAFTVTATDRRFLDLLEAKSKVKPLRQGLVSVIDSPWLITVAPFRKPHFVGQPKGVWTWWGFSLCHDKKGDFDQPGEFVRRKITHCSRSQILEETTEQLGFGSDKTHILESSACIPCLLPHAGSVWMKRKDADRPKVIPDGARNFAFLGQFCEMPKDTMFTMEYSVRSAWTAVEGLFKLDGFKPPAVYQGLEDKRAIDAVFERFVVKQAVEDVLKTPLFEEIRRQICR